MEFTSAAKLLVLTTLSFMASSGDFSVLKNQVSLSSKADMVSHSQIISEKVNGQKHGIEVVFDADKKLLSRTTFSFDERNGTHETWYGTGVRKSFAVFEKGVQVGSEWQWHANAQPFRLAQYENGKEIKVKMWRETGEIYANYVIDGERLLGLAGGQKCDSPKSKLPYFSSSDLSPVGISGSELPTDFVPLSIANFSALDQNSSRIAPDFFRGKISIVNRFFIKCNGICPLIMSRVKASLDKLKAVKDLVAVSISSDPAHDVPSKLLNYFEMRGLDAYPWKLLTANEAQSSAVSSFLHFSPLAKIENLVSKSDVHTENVYLFDKETNLRGIYNSASQADVQNLVSDAQTL
jgi:protein SCO1